MTPEFCIILFISFRTTMTMTERLLALNGVLGLRVLRSLGQFDKLNAITNNYKQRDNAREHAGQQRNEIV